MEAVRAFRTGFALGRGTGILPVIILTGKMPMGW